LYATYRDRADFYILYIREAHPTDGWQVPNNWKDHVEYAQPQTFAQREEIASTCAVNLQFTMPTLLDTMDNAAENIYNGWPERLYVLSRSGRVIYQGGRGPFGFDPEELERFLKELPTTLEMTE
jgi:hypothetical protein